MLVICCTNRFMIRENKAYFECFRIILYLMIFNTNNIMNKVSGEQFLLDTKYKLINLNNNFPNSKSSKLC